MHGLGCTGVITNQPRDAPDIWPIRCKRLARYLGSSASFRSGARNTLVFPLRLSEKGAGPFQGTINSGCDNLWSAVSRP